MDYIYVRQQTTDNGQQILSVNDVKELLKDWIKLYPNSFAPDVEFRIYQHEDDIIIRLHEDMSSLAVALLVLYFENSQQTTDNGQQSLTTAYVTIDDTEVLLKQNVGKRAMIVGSQQCCHPYRHPTRHSLYREVCCGGHLVIVGELSFPLQILFFVRECLCWRIEQHR